MLIFHDLEDKEAHDKFVVWKRANPTGFVVNHKLANEMMIHWACCRHLVFSSDDTVSLTKKKKICSLDKRELERWVASQPSMKLQECSRCDVRGTVPKCPDKY